MGSHDPLFKRLLQRFFADFLRLVAPDVAERLDLSAPVFLDKELNLPEGNRIVDLLARVPLLIEPGKALLVHIEVEARSRQGMEERLRDYHRWIQNRHSGQILSIVVYLRGGKGGIREEIAKEDLAGPGLPGFRYLAFGLEKCQAVEYLSRSEPLAWALAALMKPGSLSRARLKLDCLLKIFGSSLQDEERGVLVNCIETYLQLSPREAEELTLSAFPRIGGPRSCRPLCSHGRTGFSWRARSRACVSSCWISFKIGSDRFQTKSANESRRSALRTGYHAW